ncbi:MAG: tetraacyldisaccharide 4'-kinase [Planctomycetota bacterium]
MNPRRLLLDPAPGWHILVVRGLLRGCSLPYAAAARLRRWQFDSGRRSTTRVEVPVISVGNLTTGGTGKTPIVRYVCQRLRERGHRVAILSRGYGAVAGYNDEAMELMQHLPDVPIVQHPDRIEGARIAVQELEAEVLVLDDGFQHRRLHRDLDLVVIDATAPFGGGWMLPGGLLREPIGSLRRADLILLSRVDQVDGAERSQLTETIQELNPDADVLSTVHAIAGLDRFVSGNQNVMADPAELKGAAVVLVSAIGNPDAFERTVTHAGATILQRFDLPDHDEFSRETRQSLAGAIAAINPRPQWVLCTGKDLVKLRTDAVGGVPLAAVRINVRIQGDDDPLQQALEKIL